MAYQALYRKWRPATFDEVRGQDAVSGTLKNQILNGRIGHAYLFCGTRGCGKTSLAKIMARAVNCPDAVMHGGNPCNSCPICMSIMNGSSINVFEIDAASNNGVDNIRDLRDQVEYPPTEGRYKVYIIDEVHMLSAGAFNALLKTLEEPPSYVIFILATTDPQKVPQTILSRCQRYDFRRMAKAAIVEYIGTIRKAEGFEAEDRAVEYIAEAADGSMRDALSILDQCLAYAKGGTLTYENTLEVLGAADMAVFSELFRAICERSPERALKTVDEAAAAGKEMSLFISDFLWYLRNVLLYNAAGGAGVLEVTEDSLRLIGADAVRISKDALISMISSMAELANRARFAPRKRVLLEVELIRLSSEKREDGVEPDIDTRPQTGAEVTEKDGAPWEETEVPLQKGSAAPGPPGKPAEDHMPLHREPRISRRHNAKSPEPAEAAVQQQVAPEPSGTGEEGFPYAGGPKKNGAKKLSAADIAEPGKTFAAEPEKTVIGSKLEMIEKNWNGLLKELSASNRVLFAGTVLKEERGGILIVFRNKINFMLASKNEENGLVQLSNAALKKLGVNVPFMARVAYKNEFAEEKPVITDEDLKNIHFPVDIEG